jgi:hypothetical protein
MLVSCEHVVARENILVREHILGREYTIARRTKYAGAPVSTVREHILGRMCSLTAPVSTVRSATISPIYMRRRIHACHVSYEEEDTCMSCVI